ncbi:ATP-binding cassette domain-containing protein, partial [Rhizobium leguminosarum]|uniref:ATP-binding cassette domain-containing protein n=1 Tax=Rhizobium leguminosarum TaxID=384 RepID=UPI003F9835EF
MIKIDNLTVRFGTGQRPVVRDVSFAIEKGTAFGLVGESGCGKSTVLRALSGLNANYDGRIELHGEPLNQR